MQREQQLTWLLRLVAIAEFTALLAVMAPFSWMQTVHGWLGLGDMPDAPVVAYLARHLSALYVIHGGFLWVASCDVRRHTLLIRYICLQGFVFAVFITVLDLWAGFPWYWMAAEGPGLAVVTALILWLHLGIRPAAGDHEKPKGVEPPRQNYLVEE